MRNVSTATSTAWRARIKSGSARPHVRVTIQPLTVAKFRGGPAYVKDGKDNVYTSMVFGQTEAVRELPNVRSVSISRSIDQDVQTCSIELWNTEDIPIGATLSAEDLESHERPGWYTFNRGESGNPWGQAANEWRDWLVPDRIIRTYEGYGINPSVAADKDANMYPSGVWLVDDVILTPEGSIRLECRDVGRELLEQIMFLPVVPRDYYPLRWEKRHNISTVTEFAPTGPILDLGYSSDSGLPYIGRGIVDGGQPYIGNDGGVRGHYGRDAFDDNADTYWLSVGNQSRESTSAFEWVEGTPSGSTTVQGVRVRAWGGPYVVYISVKVAGVWKGKSYIDYKPNMVDAGTRIKYVRKGKIDRNEMKWFKVAKPNGDPWTGVEAVRVTLHRLYDSKIGTYPYRGGIRGLKYTSAIGSSTVTKSEGNYSDYADIVKTVLAWGGFYWPPASTGRSYVRSSDGTTTTLAQLSADPVLASGNVWGDVTETGVGGEDETVLDHEVWDQKPLMDAIRYVQEIVAYTFFIDENGGAVFRQPNIWKYGNYLSGDDGGPSPSRTTSLVTLDDETDILSMTHTLSSRNRRDVIFVGNVDGALGAVAYAYNKYPSGTRRVGGWTDKNFESAQEVKVMAQLIAVRQALRFQTVTVEIPANPAIQIDDQIIVRERVTGTNHLFYVAGLTDVYDAVTGRWTYQLQLQLLGTPTQLMTPGMISTSDPAARVYLSEMGYLP